jgi:hypothetical protein
MDHLYWIYCEDGNVRGPMASLERAQRFARAVRGKVIGVQADVSFDYSVPNRPLPRDAQTDQTKCPQ